MGEDAAALDTAQVLFQTALIESGYEIADPSALVNRVYRLMSKELGVDPDAPLKEIEVPEEEEEAEEDDKEEDEDEEKTDDVTLHLKEDAHDYLSEDKLKESVKKYSQFIQFPIYVKVKKEVEAEAEEEDDDDKEDEDEEKTDDVETKDDDEKEDDEESKDAPKKKTVFEWEQVNTQKAIWLRAKEDVTEEEYTEFYKSISKDYLDPLAYTHFNAEGEIEFKSILFLPKKAPFDMMDNYWTKKSEVKLFVQRILVADKFEDLLPRY